MSDGGLDAQETMQTLIENDFFLQAFYFDEDDRSINALIYCDTKEDADVNEFCYYSDDELEEISKEGAKRNADSETEAESDGFYRDHNEIAYICMTITYYSDEEKTKKVSNYCMCTVVDSKTYYIYAKSHNPNAKMSELKERAIELVENITYKNAPDYATIVATRGARQYVDDSVNEIAATNTETSTNKNESSTGTQSSSNKNQTTNRTQSSTNKYQTTTTTTQNYQGSTNQQRQSSNGSVVEHFFEKLGYRILIVAFVSIVGAGIKSMKK